MIVISKPKRFFVIGWVWIVFALASVADTASEIDKFSKNKEKYQELIENPVPGFENTINFIAPIYHKRHLLFSLSILFGVASLIAAVNFLRARKWAFQLLDTLAILMVLMILYSMTLVVKYFSAMEADGMEEQGLVYAIVVLTLSLIPFLLTSWHLRSWKIKEVFRWQDKYG